MIYECTLSTIFFVFPVRTISNPVAKLVWFDASAVLASELSRRRCCTLAWYDSRVLIVWFEANGLDHNIVQGNVILCLRNSSNLIELVQG